MENKSEVSGWIVQKDPSFSVACVIISPKTWFPKESLILPKNLIFQPHFGFYRFSELIKIQNNHYIDRAGGAFCNVNVDIG